MGIEFEIQQRTKQLKQHWHEKSTSHFLPSGINCVMSILFRKCAFGVGVPLCLAVISLPLTYTCTRSPPTQGSESLTPPSTYAALNCFLFSHMNDQITRRTPRCSPVRTRIEEAYKSPRMGILWFCHAPAWNGPTTRHVCIHTISVTGYST